MLFKFALGLAVLFASPFAFGAWKCNARFGHDRFALSVGYSGHAYSSTIRFNGHAVPANGRCFKSNVPGSRYLLCSHENSQVRIEIYPYVETVSGMVLSAQAVVWYGDHAQALDLRHCGRE
jgi:hypothetical protein